MLFRFDTYRLIIVYCFLTLTTIVLGQRTDAIEQSYKEAVVFESNAYLDSATILLLEVIEQAKKVQNNELLVKAQIQLALVFEKSEHLENCLEQLQAAEQNIKKYQLNENLGWLWVRKASYFRMKNQLDSAIIYAEKASQLDFKEQGVRAKGDALLLLTILLRDSMPEQSILHAKEAVNLFRTYGKMVSAINMLANISKIYQMQNKLAEALAYSDSVFTNIKLYQLEDSIAYQYSYYKSRSKILYQLGQIDSAYYYMDLGHQIELEFTEKQGKERVLEIQKNYDEEQNLLKIQQQSDQLVFEKRQRFILWAAISLILTLLFLLFSYNRKLFLSKKRSEALAENLLSTNKQLSASLNQQKLLLGEVHHRVKNNLQVIISLLELQVEEFEDTVVQESFQALKDRIFSMAAAHELIYQQEQMEKLEFAEYINTLFTHLVSSLALKEVPKLHLSLMNKYFDLSTLIPLGIVLNELLTNGIKYAKPKAGDLEMTLNLREEKGFYLLKYKDNGPGFLEGELNEREGGLGTYLLNSMSRQLGGKLESYNDQGAVVYFYFKEKK
jgi:two-component sensor histidine kinase